MNFFRTPLPPMPGVDRPAPPWLRVLDFWFHGDPATLHRERWFAADGSQAQADIDRRIRDDFFNLLQDAEAGGLEDWAESPLSCVALILVLDQFSRHCYRHHLDRDDKVAACDRIALPVAQGLYAAGWEAHLPVPHRVFALMPYRHSPTLENLEFVLQQVSALTALQPEHAALTERFERATRRRWQHLQGEAPAADDILEFHPFQADESTLPRSKVYQAIERFLRRQSVTSAETLCVSLSGGVDSMVIVKVLTALRERGDFGRFEILALHVDYNNRPESGAEAAYVEQWCEGHGVRFRKRAITEAKRGVTPREVYERVSREIRFALYKEAIERDGVRAVMFGHHQNDLQENVISNVMKRCQLLDIAGMLEADVTNDVLVWRPLLELQKSDIFAFAHQYGVPYFKDTTPAWSTRGTMRRQLMPLLKDMFGAGYLSNLSQLAAHSQQMSDLMQQRILGPFWAAVQPGGLAVWVDCKDHLDMPMIFWREALKHICHDILGIGLISEDPIKDQLLMRLRLAAAPDASSRSGFIELKKGHRFYLMGTTLVFLRDGFFPQKPYFVDGMAVSVGTEIACGPYIVLLEATADPGPATQLGLADILCGHFTYTIPHGTALVLTQDKEVRPKVLRAVPKPLTDPIPIIGTIGKGLPGAYVRITISADFPKATAHNPTTAS